MIFINIAIIGCGNIGSKRAMALTKDSTVKIKYIVGQKNLKKNRKAILLAKKFNAIFLTDWKEIVKKNDIDAVILSTQPNLFLKIGSAILNSKKHLLIEKPLGLNIVQSKALYFLAKKNRLVLKTGFNLRFDKGIQFAKKIIQDGQLGEIYYIKIDYVNGAVKTNKNNVGSLLDIGSHSIDLASYFINDKTIIPINSVSQANEKYHSNDNGVVVLKCKKILIFIHHSFVHWENKFFLNIMCAKGSISIKSLPKWGKQEVVLSKRKFPSGLPKKKIIYFYKDYSWLSEWLHFKSSILNNNFKSNIQGFNNMKLINNLNKINKNIV